MSGRTEQEVRKAVHLDGTQPISGFVSFERSRLHRRLIPELSSNLRRSIIAAENDLVLLWTDTRKTAVVLQDVVGTATDSSRERETARFGRYRCR